MPTVENTSFGTTNFADPSIHTLGFTPTAGRTLIAMARCVSDTVQILDCTDDDSNTWTEALHGDDDRFAIHYLSNIPSGITAIHWDMSSNFTTKTFVLEVSGLTNTSPLQDTSGWAALTESSLERSIEYTTLEVNELVVFIYDLNASRTSTGTGGVTIVDTAATDVNAGYKIPSSAETANATWDIDIGGSGNGMLVSFKPEAAGGGGSFVPFWIR